MWCLAVLSPTCFSNNRSADDSETVVFTCSVTVCGTASIPLNIARGGTTVKSDTNRVTWETTDDDVADTEVKCSANFGDPVTCDYTKPPSKSLYCKFEYFKYVMWFTAKVSYECYLAVFVIYVVTIRCAKIFFVSPLNAVAEVINFWHNWAMFNYEQCACYFFNRLFINTVSALCKFSRYY